MLVEIVLRQVCIRKKIFVCKCRESGNFPETYNFIECNNISNRYKTTEIYCNSSLGNVTSVDIRTGGTNGWLLTSLQVIDWANRTAVQFDCDCWFDSGYDPAAGSFVSTTLLSPTLGN